MPYHACSVVNFRRVKFRGFPIRERLAGDVSPVKPRDDMYSSVSANRIECGYSSTYRPRNRQQSSDEQIDLAIAHQKVCKISSSVLTRLPLFDVV